MLLGRSIRNTGGRIFIPLTSSLLNLVNGFQHRIPPPTTSTLDLDPERNDVTSSILVESFRKETFHTSHPNSRVNSFGRDTVVLRVTL